MIVMRSGAMHSGVVSQCTLCICGCVKKVSDDATMRNIISHRFVRTKKKNEEAKMKKKTAGKIGQDI